MSLSRPAVSFSCYRRTSERMRRESVWSAVAAEFRQRESRGRLIIWPAANTGEFGFGFGLFPIGSWDMRICKSNGRRSRRARLIRGSAVRKQGANNEEPTHGDAESTGQNRSGIQGGPDSLEERPYTKGPTRSFRLLAELARFDADDYLSRKAVEITRRRLFMSFERQQAAQLFKI